MTKPLVGLQDLRRRIYAKAKAEVSWRFWGLFVHVCKRETLREAYALAKKNDGAPGIDGVTFAAIEESGVDAFLEQIRDDLVSGKYVPMRNRKKEIPKDGGKKVRVLGIPTIRDRVVRVRSCSSWNQSSRPAFNRARSGTDRDGRHMKQWTGWKKRSRKARRASSIST
jgi:RNA-directed DNA polymerase